MRTKEEILEMKERLSAVLASSKGSAMGHFMFGMTVFLAMDTILKWVLGLTNDERVFDLLKPKRPEKI